MSLNRETIYQTEGYGLFTTASQGMSQRHIEILDSNKLKKLNALMFELRFKVTKNHAITGRDMLSYEGGAFSSEKLALHITSANILTLSYRNTVADTLVQLNGGAVAEGTEYHCVIAYEKGVGVKLFKNGVKTERLNADTFITDTGGGINNIRVGFRAVSSWGQIQGFKRGLRIYQGMPLISDADAALLYNGGYLLQKDCISAAIKVYLTDDFPLSQKNSATVSNTISSGLKAVLKNYTAEGTLENGNAWQLIT
jgi:hypothetical protein